MVPIMLLGKPLYKKFGGGARARRQNYEQMPDELLGDAEGNHIDQMPVVSCNLFQAIQIGKLRRNGVEALVEWFQEVVSSNPGLMVLGGAS